MPTNRVPEDADPVFRELMDALRTGKNPDHARMQQLDAKKQKAVRQAAQKALRAQKKRKGSHRKGDDGVIDTGMFN